eukprot:9483376-Pyramimonas_sp.AAC.1
MRSPRHRQPPTQLGRARRESGLRGQPSNYRQQANRAQWGCISMGQDGIAEFGDIYVEVQRSIAAYLPKQGHACRIERLRAHVCLFLFALVLQGSINSSQDCWKHIFVVALILSIGVARQGKGNHVKPNLITARHTPYTVSACTARVQMCVCVCVRARVRAR